MQLTELADQLEDVSSRYARSFGIDRDSAWFLLKLQEEVGELTQAYLLRSGQARDKGHSREQLDAMLGTELADVFCHVVLMARHHGVDLEAAIEAKWLSRLADTPRRPPSPSA